MTNAIRAVLSDEQGQGLVEYALIISLVSVAIAGALTTFKGTIVTVLTNTSAAL
jgi:pilus assembly protein Flp/PilA